MKLFPEALTIKYCARVECVDNYWRRIPHLAENVAIRLNVLKL